ncbi:MAG: winged helix-turn-helix transcriptional regulator, partial [Ignisphaera sp.]
RGSRELTEMLNDVDIAIIKILGAKGGSALQTELQNSVNVPKTTLWRHIKKLEKFGIIRVEKVGLQNRIVLIKKVKI